MIARAAALASAALLISGCTTADATPRQPANPDFTCKLTHPSTTISSMRRLPKAIRAYIKDKAGAMVDRGQFFNSGDVVTKPAPFNRFIRGGKIGADHWYLWYEHGGFAYWKQIALFDKKGAVTAEAHGGDLCAQTDALLNGKP